MRKVHYFVEFLIVYSISLVVTPLAIMLHIIDIPNERKIHSMPIPKAGGLGIFIPFLIGLAWSISFHTIVNKPDDIIFAIITALFVIIGIIDDKVELKARYKLIFQVILSSISIASGFMFKNLGWFNIPATLLWYIGIINGINLIDGLDGLAAGIGLISSLTFGAIGLFINHPEIFIVSILLALGCFGFLIYNFHPAQIFMGDTGSLPLGYVLASLGIMISNASGHTVDLLLPGIVLCIPIYDFILAMVRRRINNKPLFAPDRSHFYNLLIDIYSIGHRNTVILIYAMCVIVSVIALIFLNSGIIFKLISTLCLVVIAVILTIKLGFVTTRKKSLELSCRKIIIYR